MSLNNIALSNALLAGLYPNVLVQGATVAAPTETPVPFLGRNEKNILILINQKDAAYLSEKELGFLTTVLSACQLSVNDAAVVNWASLNDKSLAVLQAQLSPKKVLLLNVNPEEAGLPAGEWYAVQKLKGFEAVAAPSLSEIEKTKQAKSKFWVALKQLFCL